MTGPLLIICSAIVIVGGIAGIQSLLRSRKARPYVSTIVTLGSTEYRFL